MSAHRIVSLIASATEIVAALGFEGQLVGRSHECDFPPSVVQLPACSSSKVNVNGSSREIDDQVKSIVRDGLSVYRVDPKLLDELQPTVIVTQTQCEVCAVSLKDVEQAVCEMVSSQPRIVSLEPMGLADVWRDIDAVAIGLKAETAGTRLIADLQRRLAEIGQRVLKMNSPYPGPLPRGEGERKKPTIACIEWIDPLMAAGNWVPQLVDIAGGENLFGTANEHSPWMTFDDLRDGDPDVIAIMSCGFDIGRTQAEMTPLADHPDWSSLSAVKNGRVYLTDGNQYFNRPGPRLVESAEILAEILHPEQIDFGHEGKGWVRLQS